MNKYLPYIFFLLISIIITLTLFSEGKIITNSEESLNIAYPGKTSEHYQTIWYPIEAGIMNPFNLPRFPLFLALSFFEILNLPDYFPQAFFFILVIFVALSGMFLLTKSGFGLPQSVSLVAALLYTFNLFTLTQVFRRLLYSGFFTWAYLPVFALLWIKFINERSLKYLTIFLLSSLFFSMAYGHPAYVITIWSVAAVFTFYKLVKVKIFREKIKLGLTAFLGLLSWVIIHLWWIYPLVVSSGSYISDIHGEKNKNFELLKGVSPSFDSFQVLLLRQKWWLGIEQHWGWFYTNPVVWFISIVGFIIMVYGAYVSRKKLKYFGFLLLLFFVGWFISKGTNPPLGDFFFYHLFDLLPVIGSLRNSYEKFGLVLLLPYSIFLAFGINAIAKKLKAQKFITVSLLILFCVVLTWPFWLDSIFLKSEKVKIPPFYAEANSYLNNEGNGKLAHIPLPQYSDAFYDWGYSGQDPSEFLFNRKSMINPENSPLKFVFKNNDLTNIEKLIGCLNVTNIILHNEAIEKKGQVKISKEQFKNWNNARLINQFENLKIYKIDESLIKPQIFIVPMSLKDEKFSEFCLRDNFSSVVINKQTNTEYEVFIPDNTSDFILVLNENYAPFWNLKINGTNHGKGFKIFEYANGWEIKKKGTLAINIKFVIWPWD